MFGSNIPLAEKKYVMAFPELGAVNPKPGS